jgi:hypothetical protein
MSALCDRLSDDDLRELARLVRVIHADAATWRERERQDPPQEDEAAAEQSEAGP